MHFYCSAFSGEYAYQGIVLYNSIKKHDKFFTLFYVCIDNLAYDIFLSLHLDNLVLIKAEQIEDRFTVLKQVKTKRAIHEYAWTLKSSELLYILENYEEVEKIIWLDGDTQMLANPQAIFDEWGTDSIILTEQYYTSWHEPLIKTYGRFQAGFVGFCRDKQGLECLQWWQEKCIEWCYVKFEEGRWADQKYLDLVPELFPNTCAVKSLGINMTPFILYRLNFEEGKYIEVNNDGLYVDKTKIVLFHYYGFKYYDDFTYDLCSYWMKFSSSTVDYLYMPYIKACKEVVHAVESRFPDYRHSWNYSSRRISSYFDFSRHQNPSSYDFATIVRMDTLEEAIAQYLSISRHEQSFYWWACCTDASSYNILRNLKLQNSTIIYIDQVLDGSLRTEIKRSPLINKLDSLKIHLLQYLIKSNFAIKRLLFIKSDYYLIESISGVFDSSKEHDVILFNSKRLSESNQNAEFERDIIGLMNNKNVAELLQNCIDSPNVPINFTDKILKKLRTRIVGSLEYNCTLNDLKYIKCSMNNGRLYNNNHLIRAFRFNSHNKVNSNRVINNAMYKKIYGQYSKDLRFAMNEIKRFRI